MLVWLAGELFVQAQDRRPFSQRPPLPAERAPMFVLFGFDDNAYPDAVAWFADLTRNLKNPAGAGNPKTFDGAPVRATFFLCAGFGAEMAPTNHGPTADAILASWKGLADDGHEIANHTYRHPHGADFTTEEWVREIRRADQFLTEKLALPRGAIQGFRASYLEFGRGLFPALQELGYRYDSSIEAGYGTAWPGDGAHGVWWWSMGDPKTRAHLFWPHTLRRGVSPATAETTKNRLAGPLPEGIWEMTVYSYLRPEGGELTGFDYNLWQLLTKDEFRDLLIYNFELQRAGNRCPFAVNAHTDYYSEHNATANELFVKSTWQERRAALEEFLRHVLQFPDVRVVTFRDALAWTRTPTPMPRP